MSRTINTCLQFVIFSIGFRCFYNGQVNLTSKDIPWVNENWTLQCSGIQLGHDPVSVIDPFNRTVVHCERWYEPTFCISINQIEYEVVENKTADTVYITHTIAHSSTGRWTCHNNIDNGTYDLLAPLPERHLPTSLTSYAMYSMSATAGSELKPDTTHNFVVHCGCMSSNLKFVWETVPGSTLNDTSSTSSTILVCANESAFMSTLDSTASILQSVNLDETRLKVSVYIDGYELTAVDEHTYDVTFSPHRSWCEKKYTPLDTGTFYMFCSAPIWIFSIVVTWSIYHRYVRQQHGKMKGFSFILFSTTDSEDQIKVTVKPAERLKNRKKIRYDQQDYQTHFCKVKQLMQQLQTLDELFKQKTLKLGTDVPSQEVSHKQHDSGVWRNVHVQISPNYPSISVVEIQQGAQLCCHAGYEYRLLGLLKQGIMNSFMDQMEYVIPVVTEKRRNKSKPIKEGWIQASLTEEEITKIDSRLESQLKTKHDLAAKRLTLAMNMIKIAQKTNMIQKIVEAFENKICQEAGEEIALRKIPVISILVGLYNGGVRANNGDVVGAMGAILSGVVADIPGVGTILSVAIDFASMPTETPETDKYTEQEINDLNREATQILTSINLFSPESEMFGSGSGTFTEPYNESAIAYSDDISKIHIRSNDLIVGIQVEYRYAGKNKYHGGTEGSLQTMILDHNERITAVEVSTYDGAVSSLTFHTDIGKEEKYGVVRKNVKTYELTGGAYVAAIKGFDKFVKYDKKTKISPGESKCRNILRTIGFTAKLPNTYDVEKLPKQVDI